MHFHPSPLSRSFYHGVIRRATTESEVNNMEALAVDTAPHVEAAPLCEADINALAEVINRRGLYSAAPESDKFYASPAGRRMAGILAALRRPAEENTEQKAG
nr:MAG TPA: hypothetical protein [Caudoviricetes sp.]